MSIKLEHNLKSETFFNLFIYNELWNILTIKPSLSKMFWPNDVIEVLDPIKIHFFNKSLSNSFPSILGVQTNKNKDGIVIEGMLVLITDKKKLQEMIPLRAELLSERLMPSVHNKIILFWYPTLITIPVSTLVPLSHSW